jgi:hypothetical protein
VVCGPRSGAFGGIAASDRRLFVPCSDALVAADLDATGHELASVVVGPTQNFVTPSAVAGSVLVGAKSRIVAVATS